MYFKYQLSTTSTVEKVMDDIVRAILPNPDLNLMSAECDKINSELINTVTSNWELWDRVVVTPGTVAYSVLRSLNADGVTYKYMRIYFSSATAINIEVYETWNKVTHVGTNPCFSNAIWTISINQSTIFYVFANDKYALIGSKNLVAGIQYAVAGCVEFSRDDAWNTAANGYPCFTKMVFDYASSNNGYTSPIFSMPRVKTPGTDVYAGTGSGLQLITSFYNSPPPHGNYADQNEYGIARGANFNDYEVVISEGKVHKVITGFTPNYYFKGGTVLGGIKFCTPGIGAGGDELTVDGITYHYDKGTKLSMLLPKR